MTPPAGHRFSWVTRRDGHDPLRAIGATFEAFAEDHPDQAIMLVDTYDTLGGVRTAIETGRRLGTHGGDLLGIRLDPGDLAPTPKRGRALLDDAGLTAMRIIASGGIDELEIAELLAAGAPIDAFGVGTALTVSTNRAALDIAYKLDAYDGSPRAKYSESKVLLPGARQVYRDGSPDTDVLATREEPPLLGIALLAPLTPVGACMHEAATWPTQPGAAPAPGPHERGPAAMSHLAGPPRRTG